MTGIGDSVKSCSVNPLKVSPALGAAMAFLGVERSLPLFHGSQGCTAFALVLLVRHFREPIPLQTTAMSELTTILGGADNVEQAIANIRERAHPGLIGLCTTALTETRGEDMVGDLALMKERHPEWADLDVVFAATPDDVGGLEAGWSRAVTAIVEQLVPPGNDVRVLRQVNLLVGSHLTPADVESVRDTVESFGLSPIVLPDLSCSLDGHVAETYCPTSQGGTPLAAIRTMGTSILTLAIGEQMRPAAEAIERRTGVPYRLFPTLSGIDAVDDFVAALMEVSGASPQARLRRERGRLVDAMLDGHFYLDHRRVAIAADPDLLLTLSRFVSDLGGRVVAAIASQASPVLDRVTAECVTVGDLDDLERLAGRCDLIIANSHAEAAARRLGVPLWRAGFPIYDRLGTPQRLSVAYRGTAAVIFELVNAVLERDAHAHDSGHRRHAGHDADACDAAVAVG